MRGGAKHSRHLRTQEIAQQIMRINKNHWTFEFMTSCPGDSGSILETSRISERTLQDHGTSKHLISEVTICFKSDEFDEIAAPGPHVQSVWEALIGRYGIYDENH